MKKSPAANDSSAPPSETAEGQYSIPPSFASIECAKEGIGIYETGADIESDNGRNRASRSHQELSSLSHSELLAHALQSELKLQEWRSASSAFLTSLALSPEMTDVFYSRTLRALLSSALRTLDSIEVLQHVECSMPSIAAEAPQINLAQWKGLHFSEWDVDWTPASWWVSVSADGSRWGLAFNCLAKVSNISLSGRLRCSFSKDLSAVRVRFAETPDLDMTVDSSVGWGVVPLPVRESIVCMIRNEIENFVDSRLCNDEGMIIVLRRKPMLKLSESDVFEATLQARRAGNIKLRTATLF